ncbi:MAG TPA: hypothetical protein VFZ44_00090, partial [Pyrinomonadaceae bacterium]
TNTPVVILADVWTLGLERYAAPLREYDGYGFINSAVLVLWNEEDAEAVHSRLKLLDFVRATFVRLSSFDARFFRGHVSSAEELRNELRVTLSHLRQRLFASAVVRRPEVAAPLPTIAPPGTPKGEA